MGVARLMVPPEYNRVLASPQVNSRDMGKSLRISWRLASIKGRGYGDYYKRVKILTVYPFREELPAASIVP